MVIIQTSLPLRSCSVLRLRSSVPHEPILKIRKSRSIFRLRSALVRLAPEKCSCPCPRISSNRHHLLLPAPSPGHAALLPPNTPFHRLPHATHRPHWRPNVSPVLVAQNRPMHDLNS